jgi:predicted nucleic acid-binding protein
MVVVDTPIWSEFFRRSVAQAPVVDALTKIVAKGDAVLIGPIRQEILSGIRDASQFERLRTALRAFPDFPTETGDYELAATMFTRCRTRGVQGSNTDFLICAISVRLGASIFTLDQDFEHFARILPIRLHIV